MLSPVVNLVIGWSFRGKSSSNSLDGGEEIIDGRLIESVGDDEITVLLPESKLLWRQTLAMGLR